jgi:hypothetical protein
MRGWLLHPANPRILTILIQTAYLLKETGFSCKDLCCTNKRKETSISARCGLLRRFLRWRMRFAPAWRSGMTPVCPPGRAKVAGPWVRWARVLGHIVFRMFCALS